jgi:hypothetical protein
MTPACSLSDTDLEPGSPHGSDARGAEEIARGEGREASGHKGVSQRPYGKTDEAD